MKTYPSGDHLRLEQRYGTNTGGWYRDLETGDSKYVKIYENPDQSRVEALSNAIFAHLDVPAAKSKLHELDGKVAVVSDAIKGHDGVPDHILRDRPEIMGNFVTDAYLANYDVFGLWGDNVVQTADNTVYRIDNGGSLNFRARGKIKAFPHDDIPELDSMRDPHVVPMSDPSIAQSTAGRVYYGIPEAEMASQAQQLHERLTPDDIARLVAEVHFPETATRDMITKSLLGRRAFLRNRFDF